MDLGNEIFGSLYGKGEIIFRQGEPGDKMYIIQSGAIEIFRSTGEADTFLGILEKGDLLGEMALFDGLPRSASAKALGRTRLLPFTKSSLEDRLRKDPGVALHILKALSLKILRTTRRLRELQMSGESAFDADVAPFVPSAPPMDSQSPAPDFPPVKISLEESDRTWAGLKSTVVLEAGEVLFEEGDAGDCIYIIKEGLVEISQAEGGESHSVVTFGPGDFFGETALLTGNPRSATAKAKTRAHLLPIPRSEFMEKVKADPALVLYMIQSLVLELRKREKDLSDGRADHMPPLCLNPVSKRMEKLKMALVSLSTCGGCTALLLEDQEVLLHLHGAAEIVYCPMLMGRQVMGRADVVFVDGTVRAKADLEELQEARDKARYLVALGTCGVSGGIPAAANRYELEDLIDASYGETSDPFAYYLSGRRGVSRRTYQRRELSLFRKSSELDRFVKVDCYLPGCPPPPELLLQVIRELRGERPSSKTVPNICAECPRKRVSRESPSPVEHPNPCFASMGFFCVGFATKGGCHAECPKNGLPCWGCRGPSKASFKKMAEGATLEDIVSEGLIRRSGLSEGEIRPAVRKSRKDGLSFFDFERNIFRDVSRTR